MLSPQNPNILPQGHNQWLLLLAGLPQYRADEILRLRQPTEAGRRRPPPRPAGGGRSHDFDGSFCKFEGEDWDVGFWDEDG